MTGCTADPQPFGEIERRHVGVDASAPTVEDPVSPHSTLRPADDTNSWSGLLYTRSRIHWLSDPSAPNSTPRNCRKRMRKKATRRHKRRVAQGKDSYCSVPPASLALA